MTFGDIVTEFPNPKNVIVDNEKMWERDKIELGRGHIWNQRSEIV